MGSAAGNLLAAERTWHLALRERTRRLVARGQQPAGAALQMRQRAARNQADATGKRRGNLGRGPPGEFADGPASLVQIVWYAGG